MKQKYDFLQEFFKEIMVKDEDFGVIPGTQKPTLYKPGAEKLCELYGFSAHVKSKEEDRDYDTGYYRVGYTLQLIHRNSGLIVGEGVGECSTFESKYRFRWVYENKIPKHMAKEDLYFEEKEGNNGTYRLYRIPNEDLFSQWNTILKMSYKRAYVGLTLQCTRSSGIFTQEESEMDEFADVPEEDRKKKNNRPSGSSSNNQTKSNPTTTSGSTTGGGVAAAKNQALALMKTAALDWNALAAQATEALGRPIKKVIDDIKSEADWNLVSNQLQMLIDSRAAFNEDVGDELDFDKLPPELRGEK